jgi:hypothetical protein
MYYSVLCYSVVHSVNLLCSYFINESLLIVYCLPHCVIKSF